MLDYEKSLISARDKRASKTHTRETNERAKHNARERRVTRDVRGTPAFVCLSPKLGTTRSLVDVSGYEL